ncbi:hypothetical protein L6R46_06045 [Myxococcota bacterium]|nr:hypothetical protein [Myxococcota bacterium]
MSPAPRYLDLAHVLRLGDDLAAWVQRHPLWRKQEGIPTTRIRARAVLAELLNAAAIETGCAPLPVGPFDRLALVALDGMPKGRIEALAEDAGVWLWAVLQRADARAKVSTLFACWPADWSEQVQAAKRARGAA